MNKSTKVGLFVVIVTAILISSWIWLANIKFKGKSQEALLEFLDVTGLKINDPVKVWGVEKGSVKDILFKRDHIVVKILLDPDVVLYDDARAEILDVAMISGTKYIALDAGHSGVLLTPNTHIPGKASLGIPLSMIGDLGEKVGRMLTVVESAELLVSIRTILANLESATSNLSQIIAENRSDLRTTAKSTKEAVQEIKEMGEKISMATTRVDSVIADIKRGEGTLGKLTNSDSLYYELNSTIIAVRELAEDIKANPRKYIKIF